MKVYQWFYWTSDLQFWEKSQPVPGHQSSLVLPCIISLGGPGIDYIGICAVLLYLKLYLFFFKVTRSCRYWGVSLFIILNVTIAIVRIGLIFREGNFDLARGSSCVEWFYYIYFSALSWFFHLFRINFSKNA